MTMRRLVAALYCSLLVLQPALAGKLKGATRRSLQNSVILTRPPVADEPKTGAAEGKDGIPMPPSQGAEATKPPRAASAPKTATSKEKDDTEVAYDHYTWSSGEDHAMPKSVHAVVSKSLHDEYEDKMKMSSKMEEVDDHYEEPKSKETNYNRPPASASPDAKSGGNGGNGGGGNKGGGNKESGSRSVNRSDHKSNKNGGNKMRSGGGNKGGGGNKSGSGGNKEGGNKSGSSGGGKQGGGSSGDGSSYDGGSYDDMPEYRPPTQAKSSGGTKGSGGGSKQSSKGGSKSKDGSKDSSLAPPRPPGLTPEPPQPGYENPAGDPLTGVPVTRFSILYDLAEYADMPMTSDYDQVHENTYLWLYTILFQAYGDRMKNLLTDDTSNIYQQNQPVTIEYASVILFDSNDLNIPTQEELDQVVVTAFTGPNGEAYVDGIQSLPEGNPFSTITGARLVTTTPIGRTVIGSIAKRVSTAKMLPLMSLAGMFVLLAGGAAAYKSRNSSNEVGVEDKGLNAFGGDDPTVLDDYTVAMSNMSEKSGRSRQTWDLTLEVEPQENLSPITEHHIDPDLAGWSEYFDSSNGSKDSDRSNLEEHSQYSIEDFVNEAERNLLGVRIRYPGESTSPPPEDCETGVSKNEMESSTSLVPAPSSAILNAPPSSLVPAAPNAVVPHTSS